MKRWEMKQIIRGLFDNCLEIPNSSYISIEDYDEYILTGLENAGMKLVRVEEFLGCPNTIIGWEPDNEKD